MHHVGSKITEFFVAVRYIVGQKLSLLVVDSAGQNIEKRGLASPRNSKNGSHLTRLEHSRDIIQDEFVLIDLPPGQTVLLALFLNLNCIADIFEGDIDSFCCLLFDHFCHGDAVKGGHRQ